MTDQVTIDRLGHHGTRITQLEGAVASLERALILYLRVEKKMRETDVAELLGISRSHVRKVVHS